MRTNLLSTSRDLPDESERVLEANQAADQIGDEARGMAQQGLLGDKLEVQEPDFVFAKDGDGYYIRGFGDSGRLTAEGCKGLDQIYRLIQSQGEELPLLVVMDPDKDDRIGGDRRSLQPTQDTQYQGEVAKELSKRQAELQEAEAAGDPAAIAEARDEIEALSKQTSADIGAFGKPRDLNAGRRKSIEKSIRSALKRAFKSMRDARPKMVELAEHFEASINVSTSGVTYQPIGRAPEWVFARLDNK